MPVQKTLNINWFGLTKNASLMLCFQDPSSKELVSEQNLVAWKVIQAGTGPGYAPVTYVAQLAFGQTTLDAGNVVQGSRFRPLELGEESDLILDDEDQIKWTDPEKMDPSTELIQGNNKSKSKRIMSVGMLKGSSPENYAYEPTFIWKDVGNTVSVEAKFHPVLKAYVHLGYQQNEFITADLTSKHFTEIKLGPLESHTEWNFTERDDGSYSLKPRSA